MSTELNTDVCVLAESALKKRGEKRTRGEGEKTLARGKGKPSVAKTKKTAYI